MWSDRLSGSYRRGNAERRYFPSSFQAPPRRAPAEFDAAHRSFITGFCILKGRIAALPHGFERPWAAEADKNVFPIRSKRHNDANRNLRSISILDDDQVTAWQTSLMGSFPAVGKLTSLFRKQIRSTRRQQHIYKIGGCQSRKPIQMPALIKLILSL